METARPTTPPRRRGQDALGRSLRTGGGERRALRGAATTACGTRAAVRRPSSTPDDLWRPITSRGRGRAAEDPRDEAYGEARGWWTRGHISASTFAAYGLRGRENQERVCAEAVDTFPDGVVWPLGARTRLRHTELFDPKAVMLEEWSCGGRYCPAQNYGAWASRPAGGVCTRTPWGGPHKFRAPERLGTKRSSPRDWPEALGSGRRIVAITARTCA